MYEIRRERRGTCRARAEDGDLKRGLVAGPILRFVGFGGSRVAAGILTSRILGILRERAFAHFFGAGYHADVWRIALRMPNVVRYVLGEGSLSPAIVPRYSRLVEEGREEEARRFAGACLGLLAALAGVITVAGIAVAPVMVAVLVPLWQPEKQAATVQLARIFFPMVGIFVVSGWAMAVLDSHRKFFVSYVAPALWNLALIVGLIAGALVWRLGMDDLLVAAGWAALAGGLLQASLQIGAAMRRLGRIRISLGRGVAGVRDSVRSWVPVVFSRGAVNFGGWLDLFLVGLLAEGSASTLGYAQTLYLVPVSLVGISFAASELPEMSRIGSAHARALASRLTRTLDRVAYLTIPAVVCFILLGDLLVAAVLQTGAFGRPETLATWAILVAYAPGIVASASSRTLSSAFHAHGNTKTPARTALLRMVASAAVGIPLMFPLDGQLVGHSGDELSLGPAGLAVGASVGAWLEWTLLRSRLTAVIGTHQPPYRVFARYSVAALLAGLVALGALLAVGRPNGELVVWISGAVGLEPRGTAWHPIVGAILALLPFGVTYLLLTWKASGGASGGDDPAHAAGSGADDGGGGH